MRVQLPMIIADSRIAEMLEATVCGYWVEDLTARFGNGAAEATKYRLDEYPDWIVAALTPGGEAVLALSLVEGGLDMHVLDRDKIKAGLALLAETRHWDDFMCENEDGTTGDVFLQLCLFGEVVFG